MQDKTIFNNYQPKCPNCGADLDSDHKFCPFCGQNLEELNVQYRNNEEIIADAIEGIDNAKQRLEQREYQYRTSKKKTIGSKILKWILIAIGIQIVFGIISVIAFSIYDSNFNAKVANLKTELSEQTVDVVEIAPIDVTDVEFVDTDKQAAAGYIQESENVLKIPFFAEGGYNNQGVFKGYIYLSKDGLEEIRRFDADSIYLAYENFFLTIRPTNTSYYEKPFDLISIYDMEELKATQRLNDVMLGDVTFEQYRVDDTYYIIASPYHGCFIECRSDTGFGEDEVGIEDVFKVVRMDATFEIE